MTLNIFTQQTTFVWTFLLKQAYVMTLEMCDYLSDMVKQSSHIKTHQTGQKCSGFNINLRQLDITLIVFITLQM